MQTHAHSHQKHTRNTKRTNRALVELPLSVAAQPGLTPQQVAALAAAEGKMQAADRAEEERLVGFLNPLWLRCPRSTVRIPFASATHLPNKH